MGPTRSRRADLLIPLHTSDGAYQIVPGLEINDFSRGRIDSSVAELIEEREAVRTLASSSSRGMCPSCVTLERMTESQQPNPFSREGSSPADGLSPDNTPEQTTPYQPLPDESNQPVREQLALVPS
jgi:hypothetical protein